MKIYSFIFFLMMGQAFALEKSLHFEKNEIGVRMKTQSWNYDLLGSLDLESGEILSNRIKYGQYYLFSSISPAIGYRFFNFDKIDLGFLLEAHFEFEGTSRFKLPFKDTLNAARFPPLDLDIIAKVKTELIYSGNKFYLGMNFEILQALLFERDFFIKTTIIPNLILGWVF